MSTMLNVLIMSLKKHKSVLLLLVFISMANFGQANNDPDTGLTLTTSSPYSTSLKLIPLKAHNGLFQPNLALAEIEMELMNSGSYGIPVLKPRKTNPKNIISLKFGADDPWMGITYERLLIKYWGMEVQIGLIGASAGTKIYFPGTRSGGFNFHAGVQAAWGFATGRATYFPIGINYLTKNNWRISLDGGYRIWHDEPENFPGFSLKFGKAF